MSSFMLAVVWKGGIAGGGGEDEHAENDRHTSGASHQNFPM
jgi:hypothetical protein